jgi:mannose-6-phosphate isomerase-like protein (cupin superfamily)
VVTKPEAVLRSQDREGSILVAEERLSFTYAKRPGGERVTGSHVHGHAEAFYVLEGQLAFEIGAEGESITLGAGGFVAVPAGVVHSYGTVGDRPARWLVIHAPDGGFAAFMRGLRDNEKVEWDIAPVPANGGLSADRAIVRRSPGVQLPGLDSNQQPSG